MNSSVYLFIYSMLIIVIIRFMTPSGKYEKQIKLAVSLVFVCAVFIPVFEFLKTGSFEGSLYRSEFYIEYTKSSYFNEQSDLYTRTVIDTYKEALLRELNEKLAQNGYSGAEAASVEVNENSESKDFACVTAVYVRCRGDTDEASVKKIIKDFYNVKEDNIYIMKENFSAEQ